MARYLGILPEGAAARLLAITALDYQIASGSDKRSPLSKPV